MIYDLIKDITDVLEAMPQEHLQYRVLKLLDEAIRRDVHFIDRHPTTFFQCMWNTCWWYDCPDRINHYEWSSMPQHSSDGSSETPDVKLYRIMESWRQKRENLRHSPPWLRSLRPAVPPLGGALYAVLEHQDLSWCSSFSPDGSRIVTGTASGMVHVWDTKSGRHLMNWKGHEELVWAAAFTPDGRYIVTTADGETHFVLWHPETGTEFKRVSGHSSSIRQLRFSPDGKFMATASSDATVRLWRIDTWHEYAVLEGHENGVNSLDYSPDGECLATASFDGTIRIWHLAFGREVFRFKHGYQDCVVRYLPDGKRLLASHFRGIDVYCMKTGKKVAAQRHDYAKDFRKELRLSFEGHEGGINCLDVCPDGTVAATGASDKTIRMWKTDTGVELGCLRTEYTVQSLSFSPSGRFLLSSEAGFYARVWDMTNDAVQPRIRSHDDSFKIQISSDESIIATCDHSFLANAPTQVLVWDHETGRPIGALPRRSIFRTFEFLPNRRQLVTTSNDRIQVWDLGKIIHRVRRQKVRKPKLVIEVNSEVGTIACSPDGNWIAGLLSDDAISIWDSASGRQHVILRGHYKGVHKLAFSPDGNFLASASYDETIRGWDIENAAEVFRVKGEKFRWSDSENILFFQENNDAPWHAFDFTSQQPVTGKPDVDASASTQPADEFEFHQEEGWLTMALVNSATAISVAYWPTVFHLLPRKHPRRYLWTAGRTNQLYLIQLEGVVDT